MSKLHKMVIPAAVGIPLAVVALLIAAALVVGLLFLANSLVGNPVSYLMAKSALEKHMEANYPNSNYVVDKPSYDFKFGNYVAHVTSPTEIDNHFTVNISMKGKVIGDNYESQVTEKWNISYRLGMEYREKVVDVLRGAGFPYERDIAFGDLEFDFEVGDILAPNTLSRADLENNRIYDVSALGATNGEIVLYVCSDTITYEKAAEVLLTTKKLLNDAGIEFYKMEFVLKPPRDEDGTWGEGPHINLSWFRSSDIYEEGLVERIKHCATVTDEKYQEIDKNLIK